MSARGSEKPPDWAGRKLFSQFLADDPGAFHHGAELTERDIAWHMEKAAIGQHIELFGRHKSQGFADALGDDTRRLDGSIFHVDHAGTQLEGNLEFAEKIEILTAAAR